MAMVWGWGTQVRARGLPDRCGRGLQRVRVRWDPAALGQAARGTGGTEGALGLRQWWSVKFN